MAFWQNLFGFRKPRPETRFLQAKFDAAQTTAENARHWSMADALSADAAMTPDVRRTLRNRSRYEIANNSYAKGMVATVAGDCIGTGPRLQLVGDGDRNNEIEDAFAAWSDAVDLAGKLRTMRIARASDGEAFAVLVNNPRVGHPVKLDLQLIEADRITSCNALALQSPNVVDGIEYDRYGNPVTYHVLKHHPGDASFTLDEYDRVPAEMMIHWFRTDRPGQHRGIPEITPALPLFAQLRRYTLAVLAAAETAADFAAVLFTNSPANGEASDVRPLELIPLVKRMMTSLPEGWQLGQVKAEHPNTTYAEFKREILGEIGRCLLVPINVVTGDSSKHNYASGRLDHQTYFKTIRIDQSSCERTVLNRTLDAWYEEFRLQAPGVRLQEYLIAERLERNSIYHDNNYCSAQNASEGRERSDRRSGSLQPSGGSNRDAAPVRCWMWDGAEHVDPMKEAKAQQTHLASLTTTLAAEYAKQGKDWEIELRQAAKERELMKQLGLTFASSPDQPNNEDNDDEKEEGEAKGGRAAA